MDPEPPRPAWLVRSNLMSTVGALATAEFSEADVENINLMASTSSLLQELMNSVDDVIPEVILYSSP